MPTEMFGITDAEQEELSNFQRWLTMPKTDMDGRTGTLMQQIIASCCLHLSGDPRKLNDELYKDDEITIRRKTTKPRPHAPSHGVWELESAIRVNLTPAMREFIRVGGSTPKIRTMVGHWKRVAHGERRALRRVQHVLPYMRGPLDGAKSIRVK